MWKLKCALCAAVAMCVVVHSQETKNADYAFASSKDRLLQDAGNASAHVHVHSDTNLTSGDINIKLHESEYFISALFKKYDGSTNLTLDGFARLVCHLGLVPPSVRININNCDNITFAKFQTQFEIYDASNSKHEGEEGEEGKIHDHSDHSDSHHDHDHQPNRKSSGTGPETADLFTNYGYHDGDAEHGEIHEDHGDSGANSSHFSSQNHSIHIAHQTSGDERRNRRDISDNGAAVGTDGTAIHVHDNHSKCTSPGELLQHFHIPLRGLSAQDFMVLCPALIYQLDIGVCNNDHHDHHHQLDAQEPDGIPGKVWGFSIAAVMVISLAGLLGVAVIPIMQKVLYNHLLQFLVAVAVGALAGDALLHLLPHAISKNMSTDHGSHNHGEEGHADVDDHLDSVWKGLVALLCIFFFFITERILTIVTEKKRRQKNIDKVKKRHCERLCDAEKTGGVGAKLAAQNNDYANCDQMVMVVHPNKALKGYADATHDVLLHQCDENQSQAEHAFDDDNSNAALGHSHHSHGHAHGHNHHAHCHTIPGSVAAVAWMVILGDGIHNFSDGLAIGAAFANSVTGGISTSIAVMCHELPHEIGDFAVLLRAGMPVKRAIFYNCVSSLLCLIGMCVGVAIGNIRNASLWIFAGVGGMFLYISLVDMLPEMTSVETKKGENQYFHVVLQVAGMMLGSGIMLIIAIYEHDLQRLVG